jgi:xanthine dehydrogenase YagS FAD-binding subunit
MLPSFSYTRPQSLDEAIRQLGTEGARVHAGGTDLLGCLRDGVFGARKLVSLSAMTELKGVSRTADGGWRIGALTTIRQVAGHPGLREQCRVLTEAASEVASPQLRNQGTLGGNLCQKPRCWYYRGEFACLRKGGPECFAVAGQNQFHCVLGGDGCYIVHPSDTAPALVALGARAEIAGLGGKRTVPVEEFHVRPADDPERETVLAPDEVLTAILVPPPNPGQRSAYRKVRARRSWDFAVAGAALALAFDGETVTEAQVVLSGAAPVPWRAAEVEAELRGKAITAETARRAAQVALAGAAPLEHNGYKVPLLQGILEEELQRLATAE